MWFTADLRIVFQAKLSVYKHMNKGCIIIPCFNEQGNIARVIEETAHYAPQFHIVVVNDASEDQTADVAQKTGKAVVLNLATNLGVGGAVQTGLKYAVRSKMSCAVKVDGDGQHPPAAIDDVLLPLLDDSADIVIGSRFLTENTGFRSSIYRRLGIMYLQLLSFLLTGQRFTDPTSGFRAYNHRALQFMSEHYPTFDYPEPEELILASKNNLRIREVPVVMRDRIAGRSSISAGFSIYFMLKVTLAMLFIFIRQPETRTDKQC